MITMFSVKIKKYQISVIILLVWVFSLTSCKVPQKLTDMSTYEQLYREIDVTDSTNISGMSWRTLFTDPHLQTMIGNAISSNPDMKIASARIKKAEAAFRQSRADLFPSISAGFNAVVQNLNQNGQGVPEAYQLYGSTSWEADIWGKLRSAKRANLASLLASEAYERAVMTQLIASVAVNYYILLALDAQLAITEQTVEKRIRNVEVMELMKVNDMITGADLALSQANRYSAEVTIPDLKQRIYETENILSLLMGENPGPVTRSTISEQEFSAVIKAGVPAQLLANRPDVQEAEFRLRFYYEMTNVAKSYFYPSLTISARGGITETSLQALFDSPFFFWNIAGGLTQPIFNHGMNRQRLRAAEADLEEYQEVFKSTLLRAGEEVVNAMHGYQTATDKIVIRARQIEYLEKSVEFTMELLKYTSSTNYIDVLTSEVNLLSAQLNSVNDKLEQLQAIVYLYQSLGGGWKE